MGKIRFQVPENEGAQPEEANLTKTKTVELELSAENELRFHATPNQSVVYTAWKLSGTDKTFNDWLNLQKWDDKAKKFLIPVI